MDAVLVRDEDGEGKRLMNFRGYIGEYLAVKETIYVMEHKKLEKSDTCCIRKYNNS